MVNAPRKGSTTKRPARHSTTKNRSSTRGQNKHGPVKGQGNTAKKQGNDTKKQGNVAKGQGNTLNSNKKAKSRALREHRAFIVMSVVLPVLLAVSIVVGVYVQFGKMAPQRSGAVVLPSVVVGTLTKGNCGGPRDKVNTSVAIDWPTASDNDMQDLLGKFKEAFGKCQPLIAEVVQLYPELAAQAYRKMNAFVEALFRDVSQAKWPIRGIAINTLKETCNDIMALVEQSSTLNDMRAKARTLEVPDTVPKRFVSNTADLEIYLVPRISQSTQVSQALYDSMKEIIPVIGAILFPVVIENQHKVVGSSEQETNARNLPGGQSIPPPPPPPQPNARPPSPSPHVASPVINEQTQQEMWQRGAQSRARFLRWLRGNTSASAQISAIRTSLDDTMSTMHARLPARHNNG